MERDLVSPRFELPEPHAANRSSSDYQWQGIIPPTDSSKSSRYLPEIEVLNHHDNPKNVNLLDALNGTDEQDRVLGMSRESLKAWMEPSSLKTKIELGATSLVAGVEGARTARGGQVFRGSMSAWLLGVAAIADVLPAVIAASTDPTLSKGEVAKSAAWQAGTDILEMTATGLASFTFSHSLRTSEAASAAAKGAEAAVPVAQSAKVGRAPSLLDALGK